jgi:uncharacterized protein YbbK (DUF523 family)
MILVSACLAGDKCRYDGRSCADSGIENLLASNQAIKVCPEQLGGLSTPRPPAERVGEMVTTNQGKDVTKEFHLGAKIALETAQREGVTKAILKEKSPMCGVQNIYDGTFTGTLTNSSGVFTELLSEAGISVESRK